MRSNRQGSRMENMAITGYRQNTGRAVRPIGRLRGQTGVPCPHNRVIEGQHPRRVAFVRPPSCPPVRSACGGRTVRSARRPGFHRPVRSPHRSRKRRAVPLVWSTSTGGGDQTVATPCPDGPGPAIDVTRTKAVIPTAIAPMTEKTSCQVSDGMMCFTMPCVA